MDFILRQQATSDELPPWAGIIFKDPVDSDTLSEKLRAAYPSCRTLRERKHQAAIDFLQEELHRMQYGTPIPSATRTCSSSSPAVEESHRNRLEVVMDKLSEGGSGQRDSECITILPFEPLASPKRREPVVDGCQTTSNVQQSKPKALAVNAQQFVWSSHDGRSMQPKTKRKMTIEERSAYKETRRRGACDKCRRQKGRCTHLNENGEWKESFEVTDLTRRNVLTFTCKSYPLTHPYRSSPDYNDISQANQKLVKLENASDVHQANARRENSPLQPNNSSYEASNSQNVGLVNIAPRNEVSETEYVHSQDLNTHLEMNIGNFPNPWTTFTVGDTTGPTLSGYTTDTNHALPVPQTGHIEEYPFQPGMELYPNSWDISHNEPNSRHPPT